MKKRTLAVLLAAVLAASVFTGCGSRMEGDGKVQAAVTDGENGQSEPDGSSESGSSSEAETGESGTAESEPETTAEPSPEPESSDVPEAGASEGNEIGQVEAGMGTAAGYTFTELKETMYAKSQVNIRSLPSTEGEKIGKLASGDEVKVTGQCAETGWYRIAFENGTAYVSDSYIVSEKPSAQAANQGSGSSANGTTVSNNAGTTNQGQQTSTTRNEASSAFIDYLNQQRAAAGLSQVTWDSGLAEIAKSRAIAISTVFEHDASDTSHLENILGSTTSDVSSWYTQWYNSEGHRLTMLNPNLTNAAAAFYEVDGYYWVVLLAECEVPVQSAEEWNATKNDPNSGYHQMQSIENGDGWNSYGTEGVEVVTDPETIEALDAALREAGLIP